MIKRPGGSYAGGTSGSEPRRSQLIPLLSSNVDVFKKGFLIPVIGVIVVSFMTDFPLLWLFALGISGASYWFIYRLCGKAKAWWVVGGAALFSFLFLNFNVQIVGELNEKLVFPYSPGIVEEVVKALPVLLAVAAGMLLDSPLREEIGVIEPLDGILLGTASAVGFALWETMFQYVPNTMDAVIGRTHDLGFALFQGVNLIVVRFLGDIAGHMAYSGILGYAIGLAVLKPKNWKHTVLVGYIAAAVLHDVWDAFCSGPLAWIAYADAVLAYAFLAACCQKARELSPNRQQLKGSLVLDRSRALGSRLMPSVWGPSVAPPPAGPAPSVYQPPARPVGPVANVGNVASPANGNAPAGTPAYAGAATYQQQPALAPPPAPVQAPRRPSPYGPPPATADGVFLLRVGAEWVTLASGSRLTERQIPGLESKTPDGVVAEVSPHPQDPTIIGLKNLSATAWTVMDSRRQMKEVPYGKSLRLTPGSRIDFGPTQGEIVK